jgi:hypothetical protein
MNHITDSSSLSRPAEELLFLPEEIKELKRALPISNYKLWQKIRKS